MPSARLQKLIADAGLTSRRKAEALVVAGRVTVNGAVVTELGARADVDIDDVRVDGRPLPRPGRLYLALNKPRGVVSSVRDPHADRVVVDLLGSEIKQRVYPAGRLDRDSEGLVLLTNDGDLMQAMTRPGGAVDKVYRVHVRGVPTTADLDRLRVGTELDGRRLLPCTVEPLPGDGPSRSVFRVTLHEGKKNQIRRIFGDIGHGVERLVRTRIGPVRLGDLRPEAYRRLSKREETVLKRLALRQSGRAVR
ncbi:MAG TPA: pseudouridine synthase [Acidobacteriota bacterium]|nr:pseudouridine synthase [Acidobacteriota bacterium]